MRWGCLAEGLRLTLGNILRLAAPVKQRWLHLKWKQVADHNIKMVGEQLLHWSPGGPGHCPVQEIQKGSDQCWKWVNGWSCQSGKKRESERLWEKPVPTVFEKEYTVSMPICLQTQMRELVNLAVNKYIDIGVLQKSGGMKGWVGHSHFGIERIRMGAGLPFVSSWLWNLNSRKHWKTRFIYKISMGGQYLSQK